ncbi:MAG: hypothetical protein HYX34_03395 [Actinobacteria bacterium]|nr:hypothetical protein [Actinomycetota bacterium]
MTGVAAPDGDSNVSPEASASDGAARGPGPRDRPGLFRVGRALAMRGLGSLTTLVQNGVLGRTVGPAGLGLFFVWNSWSRVGGNLLAAGLPAYVLRRAAAMEAAGRVAEADALVARARRAVNLLGGGFGMVGAALMAAAAAVGLLHGDAALVAAWAFVGAVAFASTRLMADVLKARGHVDLSLFAEFSLASVLLVVVVLMVRLAGGHLSAGAGVALGAATLLAVPVTGWLLLVDRGHPAERARRPAVAERRRAAAAVVLDRRSLFHLTMLTALNILLWTMPFLVLPFVVRARDVGVFGVAGRAVAVATLNIVALSSVYAPRFARHSSRGDRRGLRRDAATAVVLSVLCYLPFLAVFLAVPGRVLAVLGGSGFAAGKSLLVIMAVGQLVNAVTGPCSDFLAMTGYERWEVASAATGVVVMLVGLVVLAPSNGIRGGAIAYAGALAVRNSVSFALMLIVLHRPLEPHAVPAPELVADLPVAP